MNTSEQEPPMPKRHLTITITPEVIARARRTDCYACALALALCEVTRLPWHVWKDSARIETLWGRKPVWKLPRDVRKFVAAFDQGEPVEPITFRLPARFGDYERWADLCLVR